MKQWIVAIAAFSMLLVNSNTKADTLVYEGGEGFGKGKHIVFIANDHEYRSEQTCPLMAKILAKHGFRCTVLFGLDEEGSIKPGSNHLPGLEALQDADLVFFFTRFMNLPDEQVKLLVDYFERGGPAVGIRTSTHCFNGQKGTWEKLNFNYNGDDYRGGLGEQVFGNTWNRQRGQSHYGSNHKMGCQLTPVQSALTHPIMTGVQQIHAYSGAYKSQPPEDAVPLLEVQVLNTFAPSDEFNLKKPVVNAGWTRNSYVAPSGAKKEARIVYASFGASEDLLGDGARRFLTNACLWAGGWENAIREDLDVSIPGSYSPSAYTQGVYYQNVLPSDLAGLNSNLMPKGATLGGVESPNFLKRSAEILENRPGLRAQLGVRFPELFGPDVDLSSHKKKN